MPVVQADESSACDIGRCAADAIDGRSGKEINLSRLKNRTLFRLRCKWAFRNPAMVRYKSAVTAGLRGSSTVRYLRCAVLIGSVALGTATEVTAVQAQTWGAPGREFARYGVRSLVCDEGPHDAPCLGLACRDGALTLVSAAGGGGPMDGPTRVSTGRSAFTVRFRYDERAIDRLGVAASEVDLTMSQFETLLEATSLTLSLQSDPSIRHRFSTRGLASEWRRAAQACE